MTTPILHVTIRAMDFELEIESSIQRIQYVSEWPPPEDSHTSQEKDTTVQDPTDSTVDWSASPPTKRRKHEPSEQYNFLPSSTATACTNAVPRRKRENVTQFAKERIEELKLRLSPDELRLVHTHYSISADVLLARWWKMGRERERCSEDSSNEVILSAIKSTSEPQSQIYHISR